ncbi:MAG: hypothetical protein ACP5HM_09735 [Anaerolineae bacterium]
MKVGLLWYEAGKRTLSDKVTRAAQRYRERFGEPPNVCYVHPQTLPQGACEVEGIRVLPSPQILPHHYWVGRETGEKEKAR